MARRKAIRVSVNALSGFVEVARVPTWHQRYWLEAPRMACLVGTLEASPEWIKVKKKWRGRGVTTWRRRAQKSGGN